MKYQDLKLMPLAIGSLPHKNVNDAMALVEKDFGEIPFPPQLKNLSKNEDMIIQLLEGMPTFSAQKPEKFSFDLGNEEFLLELEQFLADYEEIISDINSPQLENYAISENLFHSFPIFENIVHKNKPLYAKAQVAGPFTFGTALCDKNDKCIIYDETARDIIVKFLSLKILWMIKRVKLANSDTTPIIFIDEPSVSQLGTSAYMTISEDIVISMLKELSNVIQTNGGICAIHCCGKCDWRIPIKSEVDIINFDAYNFSKNFSIYHREIKQFLNNGGKIAWGMIPTSDNNILKDLTTDYFVEKFKKCIKNLTKNNIDEKLITDNSLITSSCGAGGLSVESAQIAMDLVFELSQKLRKMF